jgi:transposase
MEPTVEPVVRRVVKRRFRTPEEKRRIVEETLAPEASVAIVARRHGVNANQVFHWRKLYQGGLLGSSEVRLLPVTVASEEQETKPTPSTGAIHIEIPGRARVSVEGHVDIAVVRAVLECLRG